MKYGQGITSIPGNPWGMSLLDGPPTARYVRWQDDVWSCSTCGEDCSNAYPEESVCPNCKSRITVGERT